jgi:uncharacterized protein YecE (DUF72 family)
MKLIRSQWSSGERPDIVRKVHKRRIQIFDYANNHYAGHAPATVEQFQQMLGPLEPAKPRRMEKERSLFD